MGQCAELTGVGERESRMKAGGGRMTVLQLYNSDALTSGGAVVMHRLQSGLRDAGLDSRILCRKKSQDSSVAIPNMKRIENLLRRLTNPCGLNDLHCVSSFRIKDIEAYRAADLLHIHCIHGGYFSYLALPGLTREKPAVLTLHDMWPFTGHCAYAQDCERWISGCGQCPYLDSYPAARRDATRIEWTLKKWVYRRSNLIIVSPSRWMTEQARRSILGRFRISYIPNGVDTAVLYPQEQQKCRMELGIPLDKRVLLFVAANLDPRTTVGYRKGADLLIEAVQGLPPSLKAEILVLLVGRGGEALACRLGADSMNLGFLESDDMKAKIFSAADVLVAPSRAENCSLVLLESLACGTPIVAFAVGGVPDQVRPGITGYLAQPESVEDLRRGIAQILEDTARREYMERQCRALAVSEFDSVTFVGRYLELYRNVVQGHA